MRRPALVTWGWEASKRQWGHGLRTGQSCKRLQTPTSSHPRRAHVRKEAAAPLLPAFPTPRVRVSPDTDWLLSSLDACSRSCNGTLLRHSPRALTRPHRLRDPETPPTSRPRYQVRGLLVLVPKLAATSAGCLEGKGLRESRCQRPTGRGVGKGLGASRPFAGSGPLLAPAPAPARAHPQVGAVGAAPDRNTLAKSMAVGVSPRRSAPPPPSGSEPEAHPSDESLPAQ